jgi:predicted RNA polymerase sigma factor
MMFSCCHPRLPEKAQVALVLQILCGFSVGEIASEFVSTLCAIEKRITRAKKVLATSKRCSTWQLPLSSPRRGPETTTSQAMAGIAWQVLVGLCEQNVF